MDQVENLKQAEELLRRTNLKHFLIAVAARLLYYPYFMLFYSIQRTTKPMKIMTWNKANELLLNQGELFAKEYLPHFKLR